MFEKNDKQLLTVRIITDVVTWILAIAGIIVGIVLSALEMLAIGLPILFIVPFLSWLMWVYARLHLSYLCDIKLIRNKLYGVDSDNLNVFWVEEKTENDESYDESKVNTLTSLYHLFEKGVITEEEYNNQKMALLKDDIEHYDEYLKEAQNEETQQSTPVANDMDDLIKLKKLLDKGVISQEDFEREKRKFIK